MFSDILRSNLGSFKVICLIPMRFFRVVIFLFRVMFTTFIRNFNFCGILFSNQFLWSTCHLWLSMLYSIQLLLTHVRKSCPLISKIRGPNYDEQYDYYYNLITILAYCQQARPLSYLLGMPLNNLSFPKPLRPW